MSFGISIYQKRFMKYLIFLLLTTFIIACQESQNIEDTIHKTNSIIKKANKDWEKVIDKALYILKKYASYGKKATVALNRAKLAYQRCKKTIEELEKSDNLENCVTIQENYEKWIDKKSQKWKLGLQSFYQQERNVHKNILAKDLRKHHVYNYLIEVLGKLGASEHTNAGLFFIRPCRLLTSNKQIVEGKELELSLFLNISDRRKDYTLATTTQGEIEKAPKNTFNLNIPSKILGIQDFEVEVKVKNFDENIDITLYLQGNFEIIK